MQQFNLHSREEGDLWTRPGRTDARSFFAHRYNQNTSAQHRCGDHRVVLIAGGLRSRIIQSFIIKFRPLIGSAFLCYNRKTSFSAGLKIQNRKPLNQLVLDPEQCVFCHLIMFQISKFVFRNGLRLLSMYFLIYTQKTKIFIQVCLRGLFLYKEWRQVKNEF